MRRWGLGAAALGALVAAAAPALAAQLTTTIDLDYVYEQTNVAEDVEAAVSYRQKFEVKYETSAPVFDFVGAARLELEDTYATDAADTTRIAPTLEVEAKGEQASVKASLQAVISGTDAFEETAETESYSTNSQLEVQLTPTVWPEAKLRLQRRRDLEPGFGDTLTRTLELTLRKDFSGLVLEYDLKRDETVETLPARGRAEAGEWKGKATYKEVLWADTEFELSYEIVESARRETDREVFTSFDESSEQQLKTRLQKTLDLSPRASLKLGWELLHEEDLLGIEYDTQTSNKYLAALRYDLFSWARLGAEFKREYGLDRNPLPKDDEQELLDTLQLAADLEPLRWLRVSTKATIKWEQDVKDRSGASIERKLDETYETVVRARFERVEFTVNAANRVQHEEGWLTSREAKFRAEAKWKPIEDLSIEPYYEVVRLTEWEVRLPDPDVQRQTGEWKLRFDYRRQFLDLLQLTFLHEYGVKTEDELDAALDFEGTVQLNEETRINLALTDLVEGLKIEGEISRRAEDTEDDEDPMIVDVAYAVKLDYKFEPFAFSSSLKYNDKGDAFDDMTFNVKLELRGSALALAGEYQYDKVFADETDEGRKMNLKLSYKF